MRDKRIQNYLENGGSLFQIKSIDTIRDGGTISIKTTKGEFYIHKDTGGLHTSYPPTDENKIKDELLNEYISHNLGRYIEHLSVKITVSTKLIRILNG